MTRIRNLVRSAALRIRGSGGTRVEGRWVHGAKIGDQDRLRLLNSGVPDEVLSDLDLRLVEGNYPAEWISRGNRLLIDSSHPIPELLLRTIFQGDATGALICLASDLSNTSYLLIDGDRPVVFIGRGSMLPSGELHCGDRSALVLLGSATCTARPTLDARNGGSIFADHDQLWASDVIISTDDMHAIRHQQTGARINSYGSSIRFGKHVWIGRDAFISGGAQIGAHSIVGTRSLVRAGTYPDHVVLAGTPARVVREDVTWTREDVP